MIKTYRSLLASVALAGMLAGAMAGAAGAQVVLPKVELPKPSAADLALLRDAIDVHAHLDPDSFGPSSAQAARALDVVDMARRAKSLGMRGFVIKQHYDQTAQLAAITRKEVPGVEAFGQICMNLTVGGLNPDAVRHFAEIQGGFARIVSMPTWDSEHNIRKSRNPGRRGVAVSRNGELLPETKAVIAVVATTKTRDTGVTLTLATGHIAPDEALMVIREAKKQGITRILATHAMGAPVNMTLTQMQEAVRLGAYIEFVAGMAVGDHREFSIDEYMTAIRALGPDHVILSSDGGQLNRPTPDQMLAYLGGELSRKGVSKADLHRMMVDNPADLLGIARRP